MSDGIVIERDAYGSTFIFEEPRCSVHICSTVAYRACSLVSYLRLASFKVKRSKRLPMQTKNNTEFIKRLPQEDSAHHFGSYNKF